MKDTFPNQGPFVLIFSHCAWVEASLQTQGKSVQELNPLLDLNSAFDLQVWLGKVETNNGFSLLMASLLQHPAVRHRKLMRKDWLFGAMNRLQLRGPPCSGRGSI